MADRSSVQSVFALAPMTGRTKSLCARTRGHFQGEMPTPALIRRVANRIAASAFTEPQRSDGAPLCAREENERSKPRRLCVCRPAGDGAGGSPTARERRFPSWATS
jgi:hypothetical protein